MGYLSLPKGLGFDDGIGLRVNPRININELMLLNLEANVDTCKKHNAKTGFSHNLNADLSYKLREYLTLGFGAERSGYSSTFQEGNVWEKHYTRPYIKGSFFHDDFNVEGRYLFREHQTPNQTVGFETRFRYGKKWIMEHDLRFLRFTENNRRIGVDYKFVIGCQIKG